jgi:Carbohydrate binding domain
VLGAAAITAVAVIGQHGRSGVSPEFTVVSPPSASNPGFTGTATTGTPSTTTLPPTTAPPRTSAPPMSGPRQPIRQTPGNLLVNGDFESGLAGWVPVGRGVLDRVAIGHSGGWSVRITDGGPPAGAGDPGMRSARAVTGGTYEASAWLRATRPGTQATLALREPGGSVAGSGDLIGVTLTDAGWHQIAVVHEVAAGANMIIEVTATNLRPGDGLLVDQVSITRS